MFDIHVKLTKVLNMVETFKEELDGVDSHTIQVDEIGDETAYVLLAVQTDENLDLSNMNASLSWKGENGEEVYSNKADLSLNPDDPKKIVPVTNQLEIDINHKDEDDLGEISGAVRVKND